VLVAHTQDELVEQLKCALLRGRRDWSLPGRGGARPRLLDVVERYLEGWSKELHEGQGGAESLR
jgi:hypothetical protein